MDKSIIRDWENSIKKAIHNDGKLIYLTYNDNSQCPYCVVDPVSHAGRFNCSTCNGSGYLTAQYTVTVRAAVNRFVGGFGAIRFGNEKFSLAPVGQARITVWKEDVSRNPFSHTAKTYFESADNVQIGNMYYAVKDVAEVGAGDYDTVCVVTLERKVSEQSS